MSTPLEFSMKNPNTETGINNKSKRMPVSVWSSFAIQFDEKLKVESGLGWSFVLSQVLLTQIGSSQIPAHKTMFSNRKPASNQQLCKLICRSLVILAGLSNQDIAFSHLQNATVSLL